VKKMLFIAVLMAILSGCSTTQCQQAKLGISTAEIGLAAATTQEQREYYQKYLVAAHRVYMLNCSESVSK